MEEKHLYREVIDLTRRIKISFEERDWIQFHSPKNLTLNLASEVGELCEHFRWLTEDQSYIESPELLAQVESEIGDVVNCILYLSDVLGIEPIQAGHKKLDDLEKKYPKELCKGKALKYNKL